MHGKTKKIPNFTTEQLAWVADHIEQLPREALFTKFTAQFDRSLGRNSLAGMMRRYGGNKACFIRRNRTKEKAGSKKKNAAPQEPLLYRDTEAVRRKESELGVIIATAYKEWDPDTASFQTANALAAMRVNERLGTRHRAEDIGAAVRRMGGVYELLLDCGTE